MQSAGGGGGVFFFQAEDGIRSSPVTGVQTCALPILTMETPVHGWELEDIAASQNITMQPGDALVVYSGREKWNEDGNPLWGGDPNARPGLHSSCLKFIRESDCCLLVWDMMDFTPNGYDPAWSGHGSIFAYVIGLLDNALFPPLAVAMDEPPPLASAAVPPSPAV